MRICTEEKERKILYHTTSFSKNWSQIFPTILIIIISFMFNNLCDDKIFLMWLFYSFINYFYLFWCCWVVYSSPEWGIGWHCNHFNHCLEKGIEEWEWGEGRGRGRGRSRGRRRGRCRGNELIKCHSSGKYSVRGKGTASHQTNTHANEGTNTHTINHTINFHTFCFAFIILSSCSSTATIFCTSLSFFFFFIHTCL